jgi:hypothetical protein
MTSNIGSVTPNSSARYKTLLEAIRSGSPPTFPYAPDVDCDPSEVAALTAMPVNTHVTTARGRATITTSDKHQ